MASQPGPIWVAGQTWPKNKLPQVHCSTVDVASDQVGVVCSELFGSADVHPEDPVTEAGIEALYLVEDGGSGVT